jgi:hypothetical protein
MLSWDARAGNRGQGEVVMNCITEARAATDDLEQAKPNEQKEETNRPGLIRLTPNWQYGMTQTLIKESNDETLKEQDIN